AQIPLREASERDPQRARRSWRGGLEGRWEVAGRGSAPIGLEPARRRLEHLVVLDGPGCGEHEVRRPIPPLPVAHHGVVASPSHAARRPGYLAAEGMAAEEQLVEEAEDVVARRVDVH